jgi:dihydrodipicolinate synthase/N-acetylneuraminate lyase
LSGFAGVHCVLFALFDPDEGLDRSAMRAQVEYVAKAGADGLTVLGLATEVGKLTFAERCLLIDWAAEDAEAAGAAWLILQPPLAGTYPASEYIEFFARVGNETRLPFAIQNAPHYLGRSLSDEDIAVLRERCHNFTIIKSETPAVDLAGLVRRVGDTLTILTGRGGLEMTDCLMAGCNGFIVAPDVLPGVVACHRAWTSGQIDLAHLEYARLLPAASFAMQSLEHLTCYGKRIFGFRSGITISDRSPALRPTVFGLAAARAWASSPT